MPALLRPPQVGSFAAPRQSGVLKLVFGGLTDHQRQLGFQGPFHRPEVLPTPAGKRGKLGRDLWETRDGRGRKGQQVINCVRREVLRSGPRAACASPESSRFPGGTYALVGPPLGRTETFWGQAEQCGSTEWTAMIRRPRHRRARTTIPGMPRPATPIRPAGGWTQTTTPGMLPGACRGPLHPSDLWGMGADYNSRHAPQSEFCNSYWSSPAVGRRLTLAIPSASVLANNGSGVLKITLSMSDF